MTYTLYYKMYNVSNDANKICTISDTDLDKLRTMKKILIGRRFGNVEIRFAFILDQNMLYVGDNE